MLTLGQAKGKPGAMRTSTSVIARHGRRVSGSLLERLNRCEPVELATACHRTMCKAP
jgi:hypothetical protein